MPEGTQGPTFEGVFDVVDVAPKRHTSGNRLQITLSVPYSEKEHKKLVPFCFGQAKVFLQKFVAQKELLLEEEGA